MSPQTDIPRKMRTVRLCTANGPAGVELDEIETPRAGEGEVLVRVQAAAITRDELTWPVDRLPAIPSYEFAGHVAEMGPGAVGFLLGQAVYALSPFDRDGAAAEYISIRAEYLSPKPTRLTEVESAALPLAGLTAWQGLLEHGQLRSGQRVLIHGATGGVGALAVQLARRNGAHLIATVSSRNVEAARKLGIDEVVEHGAVRVDQSVEPVDLVFDTVGGERLERSVAIIRPGGRLVSVAAEPPRAAAQARGIEAIYFVVKPNAGQLKELARLADRGHLRPVIDRVYPLAAAREAFERSLSGKASGKIVLQVGGA